MKMVASVAFLSDFSPPLSLVTTDEYFITFIESVQLMNMKELLKYILYPNRYEKLY